MNEDKKPVCAHCSPRYDSVTGRGRAADEAPLSWDSKKSYDENLAEGRHWETSGSAEGVATNPSPDVTLHPTAGPGPEEAGTFSGRASASSPRSASRSPRKLPVEPGIRAERFAAKLAEHGYALSDDLEEEMGVLFDEERADGERCADHEVERLRSASASPPPVEEWEEQYITAVEELRKTLGIIRTWDMLNPGEAMPETVSDGPYFRKLIDDTMARTVLRHGERSSNALTGSFTIRQPNGEKALARWLTEANEEIAKLRIEVGELLEGQRALVDANGTLASGSASHEVVKDAAMSLFDIETGDEGRDWRHEVGQVRKQLEDALQAAPCARPAECGAYLGDNDGTCPQLTCIRDKGHDGAHDNVCGDREDGPVAPEVSPNAGLAADLLTEAEFPYLCVACGKIRMSTWGTCTECSDNARRAARSSSLDRLNQAHELLARCHAILENDPSLEKLPGQIAEFLWGTGQFTSPAPKEKT